MEKINQDYSADLAVIVSMNCGNHKMLLKAIWKYAKENGLVGTRTITMENLGPMEPQLPWINADAHLKKLFGKDQIRPIQDFGILKKAGHIKIRPKHLIT